MPFQFNPLTGNLDLVNTDTVNLPGGVNNSVQYKSGSAFAGTSDFTYDPATKIQTLTGTGTDKSIVRSDGSFEGTGEFPNISFFSQNVASYFGNFYIYDYDFGIWNRSTSAPLIACSTDTEDYYAFAYALTWSQIFSEFAFAGTIYMTAAAPSITLDTSLISNRNCTLSYNGSLNTCFIGFFSSTTSKFSVNGSVEITGSSRQLILPNGCNVEITGGAANVGSKIGTTDKAKIGFWGVTPIAQPTTSTAAATFVANTGTTINTASTFDGYTLQKVVKALRNAGILA